MNSAINSVDRYRFGEFVISLRQRQLLKNGHGLPLIPRYFDLLVLLVERRQSAVSRREIFDRVWADVAVSDGALSQAIRTLRRTLGDDSREPLFIRTVSRHGYSFVFPEVIEESEATTPLSRTAPSSPVIDRSIEHDEYDALIARLLSQGHETTDEDRRDAAEQLHLLGTAKAIARVTSKPHHARALALLRDTRWNVEGAGDVSFSGQPEGLAAAWELIRLRFRETLRLAERRAINAALGAATTGMIAGMIGGIVLVLMPRSQAPSTVIAVLGLLGALIGGVGAAGVAASIGVAEAIARSRRTAAIVVGAALGGAAIGLAGHLALRWTLEGLFGLHLSRIGGPLEGLSLGLVVGIGYASTTKRPAGGGMATPVGAERTSTVLMVMVCTALTGLILSLTDHPLVGGLINDITQASSGSQVALTPLSSLYDDPLFGRGTKALLAMFESGMFGLGMTAGLTRRPPR